MIRFLKRLRTLSLLRTLNKLTSKAYSVNGSIQKSDLPKAVKERASLTLDLYCEYIKHVNLEHK